MNRKLVSLLLVLLLCMSFALGASAADESAVLFDEADLLSASEENVLNARLLEISREYSAQIIVATVPAVSGGDVDTYVEYVYDSMGFGYGQNRDGVLLLVCMNPREYRILSNGFAADAISMGAIDRIGDAIVSDLSGGYYADAFHTFADRCAYYLDGHINGFPFNGGKTLLIALIVGLLAGLIVALVLKGQLKSVRKQDRASVYVKENSMHITTRRDLFLYRDVRRTRKESSKSSSGSGGSSRNVGGGSF